MTVIYRGKNAKATGLVDLPNATGSIHGSTDFFLRFLFYEISIN